jgi:GWxTD domain-containing protein
MAFVKPAALLAALILSVPVVLRALPPELAPDEDWSKSPEAYFLTSEEKREWSQLKSRESRVDFIERYWLKRDPSPGTPVNEFRDLVRARIKTADAKYAIGKKIGSRASQGYVFIVFGTPARVQQGHQAPLERPKVEELGTAPSAVGLVEGNETTITWIYDLERTPKLLDALNIPSLTINFVIEPNRPRDDLQNPGLVHEYNEKLARKTIVNPDLVPAAAAPIAAAAPSAVLAAPSSILPLTPAVRSVLEKAPPQGTPEDEKRPVFGTAVLWGARDKPDTVVWIFLPEGVDSGSGKLAVQALIRADDGGREVVTGSEPASVSTLLPTVRPGRVVTRHFDLAPGSYSAALAVTGEGDRVLAAAKIPVRVPELQSDFAISSMLLSAGTSPGGKGTDDDSFQLGTVAALPRADATFSKSESLWYFVQLANVAEDAKVTQELRLMRGPRTVAARTAPAELQEIAPGRFALGYELPLSSLEPGTYVLYVTVRDGQGHSAMRRADFRLLEGPAKVSAR